MTFKANNVKRRGTIERIAFGRLILGGGRAHVKECDFNSPGAGAGFLAEGAQLALSEEVNVALVDGDSRIVDRDRDFKAPKFFAVFVVMAMVSSFQGTKSVIHRIYIR
jgi:hypothetical protein